MTLEPRQAAPGALRRWILSALQLLWRGAGVWLALSLLMCLWIFVGHRLPLLSAMLALSALLGSILIAAQVDRSPRIRLADTLTMLRVHAPIMLRFSALITVAGAIIWVVLLAKPGVAWWNIFYTSRNALDILSPDGFVALRQIFVYSAFALGLCYFGLNIPGLTSIFQFPCMTLLGLSYRDALRLGAAGQIRNLNSVLAIGALFVVLPVLFGLLLPVLVPVLYCFFGALTYVAFREIFLGVSENRPRESAEARVAATPLSSRA